MASISHVTVTANQQLGPGWPNSSKYTALVYSSSAPDYTSMCGMHTLGEHSQWLSHDDSRPTERVYSHKKQIRITEKN